MLNKRQMLEVIDEALYTATDEEIERSNKAFVVNILVPECECEFCENPGNYCWAHPWQYYEGCDDCRKKKAEWPINGYPEGHFDRVETIKKIMAKGENDEHGS